MEAELRDGSSADIDRLRPLWLHLHHHHQQVLPTAAPYVSDAHSWAARRSLYERLLTKPDTVLLLASIDDALVGYGLAHVTDVAGTWVDDTWATGPRIGEVESLGVVPEHRGRGIGSALLHRLLSRLGDAGVKDFLIGMVAGNPAAHLYERAGFTTTWTYLARFDGRPMGQTGPLPR